MSRPIAYKKLNRAAFLARLEREPGTHVTVNRVVALASSSPPAPASTKPATKPNVPAQLAAQKAVSDARKVRLAATPDANHPALRRLASALRGTWLARSPEKVQAALAKRWAELVHGGEIT